MKLSIAARRSSLISISVIGAALVWEVLTFELPRPGRASNVSDQLAIHASLLALVSLAAVFGNLLAFCTFRSTAFLTPLRALMLGVGSAAVIFFGIVPLLKNGGLMAVFLGVAILSFIITATVGRLLSRHGA